MKLMKLKWLKFLVWVVLGIFLILTSYGLLQLIEPVGIAPVAQSDQPPNFRGRALLVASDADMVATAYADAQLHRVAGIEDTLTLVELPLDATKPGVIPVQVSNSVMSWPQNIAVSPSKQWAYVSEVRSRPADGIQAFESIDQMPPGERITVVNIANLQQPKVLQTVVVGRNPKTLSISPDGKFLAVTSEEPDRELAIFQIQPDGTLGERDNFAIAKDFSRSAVPGSVVWHPSGRFLAITTTSDGSEGSYNSFVAFYNVIQNNSGIRLELYDRPLVVGNHLSNGRFSADGQFFLVPDLKWRMYGLRALNYLLNPKGEMISIRFAPETSEPPAVVSRTEVGLGSEGFALSPDNTLVVTVNLRRTYLSTLPPVWRGKPYSSLSLVKFDRTSGQLTTVSEYGFEGLLPEQVAFDATGKSLAVVIYHHREANPKTGAIEFWNVISGNHPRLERSSYKIDVVRGAHDIVVVP
ncbi:beta-propeller fold lactonase family protein [Nodosilinea sp. LEGE 07088]|uniref:beta-propeller fold lactonase family protein n=1 Tax=Nodosilinea sp. LEGE 07088 TaxID=2777968 RepID=UPI00187DE3A6|nr:beta-propeller fold lactonase family protein [Nodosilinea sp. LEGE 07088]MBE9140206.1 beta-propeller fold lactonase family protein [Nodosilinea sp. LEGE 07088]